MHRTIVLAAFALLSGASLASADTYAEKVKSVDPAKHSLTIPVEGKDRELKVSEKVDVKTQVRRGRRLTVVAVKEGLKGVKAGVNATITTEKQDGQEVVTKIVVLIPEKK